MRIFIILLFVLAWYFFSWTYIDLKQNNCCQDPGSPVAQSHNDAADDLASIDTIEEDDTSFDPASDIEDIHPVTFRWSDATPIFGPDFTAWRDSLVQLAENGGRITLTGLQFNNERQSGLALRRANAIKEVLEDVISPDQLTVQGERRNTRVPSQEDPFSALLMTASAAASGGPAESEISNVYFDWGSTQGTVSNAMDRLLADIAKQAIDSGAIVELTGHTDDTSSSGFNERLGARRANAVRAVLIQKGVPESQIRVRSKGETEPIASNTTGEGRKRNRRVEVKLISN